MDILFVSIKIISLIFVIVGMFTLLFKILFEIANISNCNKKLTFVLIITFVFLGGTGIFGFTIYSINFFIGGL